MTDTSYRADAPNAFATAKIMRQVWDKFLDHEVRVLRALQPDKTETPSQMIEADLRLLEDFESEMLRWERQGFGV